MSAGVIYPGSVQQVVQQVLTSSSVKVGDTATDGTQTLTGVIFANDTSAAVNCSLYWYDGTTERLIWKKPVPANDSATLIDLPVRMKEGDEIRAKGAANTYVSLIYTLNNSNR